MNLGKLNNLDKKQMNTYLFFIFVLGLVNAFYQIAIIKQLSIGSPFASITLIVNIIVSLTLFSVGFGAYLSKFVRSSKIKLVELGAALSVLLVFIFLLRFLPDLSFASAWSAIYIIILLSLPMILLGILIAKVYQMFIGHKASIAKLVFWHTLGFALGQILAYLLIKFIGANALFLIIFFVFFVFALKRKIFFTSLAILIIILSVWSLDNQLENFRNKEMMLWPNTEGTEHVYSSWSPYVKVDIFQFDDCVAGVYNYGQQWMTCKDRNKDFELRSRLYPELDGDILLIGAGGGMGVSQFDDDDNVTGVELDPLVVDLMKGRFSEYNNNAYNNFNVVNADGREFLESTDQKYDYIIYEGTDYTFAVKSKNFIEVENYLYTEEGLGLALGALKRDGALILIHTFGEAPIARTIDAIPEKYQVDLREYYTELPVPFGGLILTVSKDIFTFDYLRRFYNSEPEIFESYKGQLPDYKKISDNKPFLYALKEDNIAMFIYYSLLLFVIIFLALVFWPLKNRSSKLYFFLLGTAMIVSELFFITELRSLFGNYILTFIIFSLIFFAAYSFGNYYFVKLKKYISFTPIVLLLALIMVQFIPWGASLFIKSLFTIILLVPSALCLGIFFPLALSKIKAEELPFAYMIDSLGVALGFFLFYLASIFYGFVFSFSLVIGLYIILLILLKKFDN
jgi:hypothetical protein